MAPARTMWSRQKPLAREGGSGAGPPELHPARDDHTGAVRKVETVDRAMRLLQLFVRHEQELTVGALAAQLGVHHTSASRLAGTMVDRGFLERVPGSEALRLGPEIARLGMLAVASRDLVRDAREAMSELAEQTGETVVLSVLDHLEAVDVAQEDSSHRIGTRNWSGQRSPLHASSNGKVFLAFAGIDLHRLPRPTLTPRTITRLDDLRAEIERTRERGWGAARSELELGLNGIAVPVWDGEDRCVAALSVSGPEYRLPEPKLPEVAELARAAAARIGRRLGRAAD